MFFHCRKQCFFSLLVENNVKQIEGEVKASGEPGWGAASNDVIG